MKRAGFELYRVVIRILSCKNGAELAMEFLRAALEALETLQALSELCKEKRLLSRSSQRVVTKITGVRDLVSKIVQDWDGGLEVKLDGVMLMDSAALFAASKREQPTVHTKEQVPRLTRCVWVCLVAAVAAWELRSRGVDARRVQVEARKLDLPVSHGLGEMDSDEDE